MEVIREVFLEKINSEWGFIRRGKASNQKTGVHAVEVMETYKQERSLQRTTSWTDWAPELGQRFLTGAAYPNHLGRFLELTCCPPLSQDSESVDLRWPSVLFLYLYM